VESAAFLGVVTEAELPGAPAVNQSRLLGYLTITTTPSLYRPNSNLIVPTGFGESKFADRKLFCRIISKRGKREFL
jgi:hypothetical protein